MRWKVLDEGASPTLVAVLASGDDAVRDLTALVRDQGITAAQVTAVGAFERATVGWFDRVAKRYRPLEVDEQCEALSLVGDVAVGGDGPELHLHAVLGLSDGSTRGGHLLAGDVFPTLEVILRTSPAALQKKARPDLGVALIDLDET